MKNLREERIMFHISVLSCEAGNRMGLFFFLLYWVEGAILLLLETQREGIACMNTRFSSAVKFNLQLGLKPILIMNSDVSS